MAGRLVDGYDVVIDGHSPVYSPPPWISELAAQGYRADVDGAVTFVVTQAGSGVVAQFETIRDALPFARDSLVRALARDVPAPRSRRTDREWTISPGAAVAGTPPVGASPRPPDGGRPR